MKPSGINWLGDIPAHWEVGNIRRYADMRTGHTPSRQNPEYWTDCAIPWFTLADVRQLRSGVRVYLGETTERISEIGLANSAAELLPTGTVILSRTASVGYTGIMPKPMATSQDFWNWVCGPRLHPEYLLWQFRAMVHVFSTLTSGSTHKTIYRGDAASLRLMLPPRDEQAVIANFLNERTARIDGLIARKKRLLELLAEKRQALITRAVTKGLDPDAPMKPSGIDWLGDIPAHWEVGNLRRYADMRTGHTPSRQNAEYWTDCAIPWFTLADVWQLRLGVQIYLGETTERVSEVGLANSAAELLPTGTVILSRTASVGYTGIMPKPMATSQDFWNWVCGPRLHPEYLLWELRGMVHVFSMLTSGSTHKTIYRGDAASLRLVLPPQDEQERIADHVTRRTGEIDNISTKIECSIERLREHRTALIIAAATGRLDIEAA